MTIRLRFIDRFVDRNGHERLYFRRKGEKRIPLPAMTDPSFHEAYRAALNSSSKPVRTRGAPGTFKALAELYYGSTNFLTLRPSTQAKNRGLIDAFCVKYGDRPVAGLARKNVEAILREKAKTPAGANNLLKIIRLLMGFAMSHDWRTDDPTAKIKKFTEGTYHTWTEAEIAQFEAKWPIGSRERLAFALHLYTGQRRADVARMTWAAYDPANCTIEVRQEKTGTALVLPAHRDLREILAGEVKRHVMILSTRSGKAFTIESYGNLMADAIAEAGLPDRCVLHGLRKAAARRLAEAGCTAHEIMSMTGHKTLSEVERYTKAAEQRGLAQAAVIRLEERFGTENPNPKKQVGNKGRKTK